MNKITAEEALESLELLKRYGNEQTDVMDLYRSIDSFINQQLKANEPLTDILTKIDRYVYLQRQTRTPNCSITNEEAIEMDWLEKFFAETCNGRVKRDYWLRPFATKTEGN